MERVGVHPVRGREVKRNFWTVLMAGDTGSKDAGEELVCVYKRTNDNQ